jgi:hypothetical protein
MNADIHIHDNQPGLVPWGFFDIMLEGIKKALDAIPYIDRRGIFNEGRFELYLDELSEDDFNVFMFKIDDYVSSLKAGEFSERFANFWNDELIPLVESDPRFKGELTKI